MPSWMIETIGGLAAVIGTIGWLPQALKTIRTKNTKDLSLSTNLMLLTTVALWFVYGLALGSWPLIIGNIISIMLIGIIVVIILKNRHQINDEPSD